MLSYPDHKVLQEKARRKLMKVSLLKISAIFLLSLIPSRHFFVVRKAAVLVPHTGG